MSDGQVPAPRLRLLLPGDPATATGGYRYDRRMAEGLELLGWRVQVLCLDASFPAPTQLALEHAEQTLAGIEAGACVLIDGLALGAMPDLAQRHAGRLRLIGLVHHPLAAETGLTAQRAQALRDSERQALQAVRGVIVTSAETASALGDYGVPAARIRVVEPGTAASPLAPSRGARGGSGIALLCVATLSPRKGHDLLLRALARLRHLDWHLTLAGSLARDPATSAALQAEAGRLGLGARVTFAGEVGEAALQRLYGSADLFVLPSHYEGYGMAVAEALMQALPIVATTTGAIARIVPVDAGLLVPPGDEAALAGALARVLGDPALRRRLADGAERARHGLRSWPQAAAELAAALQSLAGP